jgi:hypothetical protein
MGCLMEQTKAVDSNTLTSQVVSLWTFVFNQLIGSAVTLIIIWAVAGDFIEASAQQWLKQFDPNSGLLNFFDQIGLEDKLWIVVLVVLLSILYVNARLTNAVANLIPFHLVYIPLLGPRHALAEELAQLWTLKPEIKTYSELVSFIELERAQRQLKAEKETLTDIGTKTYKGMQEIIDQSYRSSRKAIYFILFTLGFYLVASHFHWADRTAGRNTALIVIACVIASAIKTLEVVYFRTTAYEAMVYGLISELKSSSALPDDQPQITAEIIKAKAKQDFVSPWRWVSGIRVVDFTVIAYRDWKIRRKWRK